MCFLSFSLSFVFVLVETAVNIGYSCKLLDPDTRLLDWQELRLSTMKYRHNTGTLSSHITSCVFVCLTRRQILKSPDPGVSFFKARQTELWAVDKEMAGTKAAVVLTGPELVNTGPSSDGCHVVCK